MSFLEPHHQQESTSRSKPKWSLTEAAFEKLLRSFSSNRDEAGAQYEMIRCKLVRFFEWRGIKTADEQADETINRVARRIDEGQTIENLKSYFYGVARLVVREAIRERDLAPVSVDDASQALKQSTPEEAEPDARLLCFDQCLDSLTLNNRKLILDYYQDDRRAKIELRQELAERLKIPLNALRIRAHRIRVSLEKCITNCLEAGLTTK